MKLLKEADKAALYEAALYNIDLLEDSSTRVTYEADRVIVTGMKPISIADIGVDWSRTSGKTFDASACNLVSCEGFPKRYNGSILIQRNALKNLKGMPEHVYGEVWVNGNKQLTSLEGAPKQCDKLYISDCENLTSLEHCPEAVDDVIGTSCYGLKSLKGLPKRMKMFDVFTDEELDFDCDVLQCNEIFIFSENTSLKGFEKAFKGAIEINFAKTPIKSHILGLLKINGLKRVETVSAAYELGEAFKILNKHLPSNGNMKAILECQDELIDAGLDEFAKL